MAFRDDMHGIVGGGDLASNKAAVTATSSDGGQTWTLTNKPPVSGTIFCLAYVQGMRLNYPSAATTGYERAVVVTSEAAPIFNTGQAAWSPDEGQTWYQLPHVRGYWAVGFANPQAGWFVGNNGQILKISF